MIPITNQAEASLLELPQKTPLFSALKAIREQSQDETLNTQIQAIEASMASGASDDEINEQLKTVFQSKIKGSPSQALWVGTAAFFFGFPPSIGVASITALTKLPPTSKMAVTGLAFLSGAFSRLLLGIHAGRNGGRDLTLTFLALGLSGLLLATAISEMTDLNEVSSLSTPYAKGLLASSLLSGFGLGVFQQVNNVKLWQKKNEADKSVGIFGGTSGFSPAIFGFIHLALNELAPNAALNAMSVLLIASISAAGLSFKYSDAFRLNNSPCHQLIEQFSLQQNEAEPIAKACGQFYFPKVNTNGDWLALANQLKNPSTRIIMFNYFDGFGTFLATTTAGSITLTYWNHSPQDILFIISMFSLWSNVCRTGTAWPINFLDKDPLGGGVLNGFATLLIISATLGIAIPNKIPTPEELYFTFFLLATGTGIKSSVSMKLPSSEKEKELIYPKDTPLDCDLTIALASCIGPIGCLPGTMGAGLLASLYADNPGLGYVQINYVIAALSALSGLLTTHMCYKNKEALHHLKIDESSTATIKYSDFLSSDRTLYKTPPRDEIPLNKGEPSRYGALEQREPNIKWFQCK